MSEQGYLPGYESHSLLPRPLSSQMLAEVVLCGAGKEAVESLEMILAEDERNFVSRFFLHFYAPKNVGILPALERLAETGWNPFPANGEAKPE